MIVQRRFRGFGYWKPSSRRVLPPVGGGGGGGGCGRPARSFRSCNMVLRPYELAQEVQSGRPSEPLVESHTHFSARLSSPPRSGAIAYVRFSACKACVDLESRWHRLGTLNFCRRSHEQGSDDAASGPPSCRQGPLVSFRLLSSLNLCLLLLSRTAIAPSHHLETLHSPPKCVLLSLAVLRMSFPLRLHACARSAPASATPKDDRTCANTTLQHAQLPGSFPPQQRPCVAETSPDPRRSQAVAEGGSTIGHARMGKDGGCTGTPRMGKIGTTGSQC